MKAIVCGGREFDDTKLIYSQLDAMHKQRRFTLIVEGGARGADRLARMWAQSRGVPYRTYNADWEKHGKAAGTLRNKQMLESEAPDIVIAFPGGNGTAHMMSIASKAGVEVFKVKRDEEFRRLPDGE